MSIIVEQDATLYSFIIFLQTALHVSGVTFIHHQEHRQTVITTSGTGRTVFATVRWYAGKRTVANTVRPVPDVVITVCVCSWWWMKVSSETCRAVCRNIIKLYIVASCWTIIDSITFCIHCILNCSAADITTCTSQLLSTALYCLTVNVLFIEYDPFFDFCSA